MSQGSSFSGFRTPPQASSTRSSGPSESSNSGLITFNPANEKKTKSGRITTSEAIKILGFDSSSERTFASSHKGSSTPSQVSSTSQSPTVQPSNPFTAPRPISKTTVAETSGSSPPSSEASSHKLTKSQSHQIRSMAKKNRSRYPTGSSSSGISLPSQPRQSSLPSFHPYLPTQSSASSAETVTPQKANGNAAASTKSMPAPSHPSRSSQREKSHQPNPFAESPHVALTEPMPRRGRFVEPQQTRLFSQSLTSTVPLPRETTGLTPSVISASTLPNSFASSEARTSGLNSSVFSVRTISNKSFAHPGFTWSHPSNSKLRYDHQSILNNIFEMALYGNKMTSTYSIDLIGNLPCPDPVQNKPFDSDTYVSSFYDETKEFIYNYEYHTIEESGKWWDKHKLFSFNILYRCNIDWLGKPLLEYLLQKANAEKVLEQARNPVSISKNLVFQIVRPRIGKSIAFIPFTNTIDDPVIVLKSLCIFVGLVAQMNECHSSQGNLRWYHLNININNIIWDERNYLFKLYDFALSGPNFNFMKYYIYYNYIEKTMNGPPLTVGENYHIWLFRSPELNELYNVYWYIAQLIKQNYNTSTSFNVFSIINSSNQEQYKNHFKETYTDNMKKEYQKYFPIINRYVNQGYIFPNEQNIDKFIDHIKNALHYHTSKGSINSIIGALKFDEFIDMGKQDSWGVASSLSYLIQQNQILNLHPIGIQILEIMAEHVLNHPNPKDRKNLNELYDIIKQDEIIKQLWPEGTQLPDRGNVEMYENLLKLVQTYRAK